MIDPSPDSDRATRARELPGDAGFALFTGAGDGYDIRTAPMVICPACQSACSPKARFCPKCGHQFDAGKTTALSREASTAAASPGEGTETEPLSTGSSATATQEMPRTAPEPAAPPPIAPAPEPVRRDDSARVVKEDTIGPYIPNGAVPVAADLDVIQRNAEEKLQGVSPPGGAGDIASEFSEFQPGVRSRAADAPSRCGW